LAVADNDPLLRVCSLLNKHSAKYLIIGGHACILHGLVRTTEDVDILVEGSVENLAKVITALSEMEDGAAKELTPRDLLENVIVKIADEVEVDVSRSAWRISYEDAIGAALRVEIDGVNVPYVDLKTLIATKETPREQDRADVQRLKRLLNQKRRK
jgi:predicted nucleotidyltransferase